MEDVPVAVIANLLLESQIFSLPSVTAAMVYVPHQFFQLPIYSDNEKPSDYVFIYEMHSAIYVELYGTGAFHWETGHQVIQFGLDTC